MEIEKVENFCIVAIRSIMRGWTKIISYKDPFTVLLNFGRGIE